MIKSSMGVQSLTKVFKSNIPMGIDSGIEIHSVDVSTDANGDGSATVTFDADFNAVSDYVALPVIKGGLDGYISVNNKAVGSVDVVITGSSTTSGTVSVDVVVIGLR